MSYLVLYCFHRMIDVIATIISSADALSMESMAASESNMIESLESNRVHLVVIYIQLIILCGECNK